MSDKPKPVGAGCTRYNPERTTPDRRFWVDYSNNTRVFYKAADRSEALLFVSLITGELSSNGRVTKVTQSIIDDMDKAKENEAWQLQ